jgi:Mn2+/Fe2+ NRAMP family transporter
LDLVADLPLDGGHSGHQRPYRSYYGARDRRKFAGALPQLAPRISLDRDFWLTITAILGTTISPYLFFWQAAQEVEDTKAKPTREPLLEQPRQGAGALARIQLDTLVGMGVSNLVALAIMVTAAATLHQTGVHTLTSAAQAAEALRPLAGRAASSFSSEGITHILSPLISGGHLEVIKTRTSQAVQGQAHLLLHRHVSRVEVQSTSGYLTCHGV